MKLLLVFPRFKYVSGDPPLGPAYLAAEARAKPGVEVAVEDATFHRSFRRIAQRIDEWRPDVVGVYFDSIMFADGVRVARMARQRGIFTIAGGPHATVMPETLAAEVDVICIGEGDVTLPEVLEHVRDRDFERVKGLAWQAGSDLARTESPPPIADLDAVPFPARDLLDMQSYVQQWNYLDSHDIRLRGTTMITSRGCPFRCTYCQPTLRRIFGPKVRMRSPENVVAEILELKDRYKIDGIFFHDDTLTAKRSWVEELCDRLIDRGRPLLWACNTRANTVDEAMLRRMHEAGLRNIHLGIESGTERILRDIYQKGIDLDQVRAAVDAAKRIGVTVLGFFMIGAPTETPDEIDATIRFARSLRLDEATFAITSPLPGTTLYDMVADGPYRLSADFADFDYYSERGFEDRHLPLRRLKALHLKALLSFYLHPYRWPYILRHLLTPLGWRKLFRKLMRYA